MWAHFKSNLHGARELGSGDKIQQRIGNAIDKYWNVGPRDGVAHNHQSGCGFSIVLIRI